MDNLVSILKIPALNHDVKNKILRYIQDWAIAFEGKPSLSYVGEVYRTLQREGVYAPSWRESCVNDASPIGYNFPPRDPALTSSAMVDTQTAPEWIDSELCLVCRDPFTFTNRKHHCRNCGKVVCQQCSSKNLALPHFGIAQEVRVCDPCYRTLTKKNKYVFSAAIDVRRRLTALVAGRTALHRVFPPRGTVKLATLPTLTCSAPYSSPWRRSALLEVDALATFRLRLHGKSQSHPSSTVPVVPTQRPLVTKKRTTLT